MNGKVGYWDHKTKPSTFVVSQNNKIIYRGTFNEGSKLLSEQSRDNYQDKVKKYFEQPNLLTPKK
jgi:hypothetical protein